MAVYYKFNSEKDVNSVSLGDSPFISIAELKEKIFQAKQLYRGKDCYLVVSNAQTKEEYLNEEMLIPKCISVLIRRVPGWLYTTIVTEHKKKVENKVAETEPETNDIPAAEDSKWDDFVDESPAIPHVSPVQSNNLIPKLPPINKAEEDAKIKALIDTPLLKWDRQEVPRWMAGQHGFGLQQKTPPPGYVCHRCGVPGHFIQHCPTNGDPNYDFIGVRSHPLALQDQCLKGSHRVQNLNICNKPLVREAFP